MDKQPVGQLPDLTQSNNDDEIMVITNDEYNQLKKEKISDFITDLTSTDENNAIIKGTDGKLFTKDFGNASNITEGTLPVSVLPDIPKNKLPEIETDDLPDSGITAGAYTYPTDIVINSKGQVTSITEGQAGANNANQDLSNLGPLGLDKLNQSKALETGSVSSDADVYADVLKYKNSGTGTGIDAIKPDNYEVVGTPTITEDGIASGFSAENYVNHTFNAIGVINKEVKLRFKMKSNATPSGSAWFLELLGDGYSGSTASSYRFYWEASTKMFVYIQDKGSDYDHGIFSPALFVNEWYTAEFTFKGANGNSNISLELFHNNESIGTWSESPVKSLNSITLLNIGVGGTNSTLDSTIDLNSIELYVDGNLIYQPCLKIPYTQSKTGSKIVDAVYRDRVQDVYEQFGYAPYYTIDEENQNFTLPMGEIYGMIAQNKTFDGFSLFDTKLTDRILTGDEALGWALQGSLVTMTYPDAVNRIKELYTAGTDSTYRGISCKKTTDGRYIADISQKTTIDTVYSETGIADFYILDSTNNQFYLPRNKYFMQLTDSPTLLNNYNKPGLPNITGTFDGIDKYAGDPTGAFAIEDSIKGATGGGTDYIASFDDSRCSAVYGNSETVQPPSSNKLLYYKVGHTVTNSGSIDVANVLSDINLLEANKADKDLSNCTKPYVTETYQNGASGYLVWSDGFCEQWGFVTGSSTALTYAPIILLKAYKDTNYNILLTSNVSSGTANVNCFISSKDTTSFIASYDRCNGGYWKTCGYIA